MRACGGAAREMPCEACGVQFSVFRRKRSCSECARLYCAACLRRGGGMCAPCRALSTRPLQRAAIAHLKPRDLQCFLQRQNISTRGCVEKEELVSLCVCHVNSAAYRRRGSAAGSVPFTLKGLTTNINEFINTTFSTQPPPAPAGDCLNAAHAPPPPAPAPAPAFSPSPAQGSQRHERFTTNPGGERDFRVPPPEPEAGAGAQSPVGALRDTADCFEVEDLDDQGWEFVTRPPADPLPGDSEVLMASPTEAGRTLSSNGTPLRAASLLELRTAARPATPPAAPVDRASLADDALLHTSAEEEVSLETLTPERVEALGVRALKALLARNRVEYQSCVERGELQARVLVLLRDHATSRAQLDALPLDECCKICMAAPLECVLLECGHIAACTQCAKQLAECPICRRYVVRAVRCFRA